MKKQRPRKKKSGGLVLAAKWAAGLGAAGLVVYLLTTAAPVPYDERAIAVVDFSILDDDQKLEALRAANDARCTCGCGLGLAECVATDSTCPIRLDNIDRIRGMVRDALD
jgi:hypothetical protein